MTSLAANISVAIPNWNGEAVLPDCLNSLRLALRRAGLTDRVDIVIADDQSTDQGPAIVRRDVPEVRWIDMPQRSGFGVVANTAVQHAANDYVLLLNNDIYVEEDFFQHWAPHFEDPQVFALASWMLRWDRRTVDSGRRVAVWDKGLIRHWVVEDRGQAPLPTFYACGGASIYDRRKYLEIGGFDPLFKPMYTEDLDLSYVGWKRGWKVLYEPKCVVYHRNSHSSSRAFKQRIKYLNDTKNHFLFVWKNITDPVLFRQHLAWLPLRVAAAPFHGRRLLTAAFVKALRQLDEALAQRRALQRVQQVSDRALFDLFRPTAHDLAHSPYQGTAGAA
ncbi:MAG: glycosyltransferase [Anaerolineales bacterium]|nr:glycosyltransferase [Anaerolineales bacterium]